MFQQRILLFPYPPNKLLTYTLTITITVSHPTHLTQARSAQTLKLSPKVKNNYFQHTSQT